MNKLLIPTILVATVMIAGAFAFMPIEKATTVHIQIIDSIGQTANVIEDRATLLTSGVDVACTVTSTNDYIIIEIYLDNSPTTGGDKSFRIQDMFVDGVTVGGPLNAAPLTIATGDMEAYIPLFPIMKNPGNFQQMGPIPVEGGEDFVFVLDNDDGSNTKLVDVIMGIQGGSGASINCV